MGFEFVWEPVEVGSGLWALHKRFMYTIEGL